MTSTIAYVINQYPKVSHSFIRTEMLALEERGYQVERIAMRGWDAEVVDPLDESERGLTFYLLQRGAVPLLAATLRVAIAAPRSFLTALGAVRRLARGGERGLAIHLIYLAEACLALGRMRRVGAVHVHAQFGSNAASIAMLAHILGGPPWSFTVHGPEEFDKPLQFKLREKIARAAFVVAISSFGRSQLYRWSTPGDWPKIAVVHCAIDPRFVATPALPPPSSERLVCVGRLCEQKGQLLLVEAVAALRRRGVAVRLILAGDGEMRADVEGAVAAHGLADAVTITGWVGANRVRTELEQARGLVLASFGEGLPVAIMEAMALRRPVVTTYIAGIPELVRNEVDGLLVPAGDIDALAGALERLLAMSETDLATMGDAAAARVGERHVAATEAAKLARLIKASIAAA